VDHAAGSESKAQRDIIPGRQVEVAVEARTGRHHPHTGNFLPFASPRLAAFLDLSFDIYALSVSAGVQLVEQAALVSDLGEPIES
jgi:hypothetical protein